MYILYNVFCVCSVCASHAVVFRKNTLGSCLSSLHPSLDRYMNRYIHTQLPAQLRSV
jgi:hypothetical protein